jgi:hypothetical protein
MGNVDEDMGVRQPQGNEALRIRSKMADTRQPNQPRGISLRRVRYINLPSAIVPVLRIAPLEPTLQHLRYLKNQTQPPAPRRLYINRLKRIRTCHHERRD